jgi:hypothetical protein
MVEFGVHMPKEPKITKMDWRSLGYWPVWKDGKKVWVPKDAESFNKNTKN